VAFVALILVGNSLTEAGAPTARTPEAALAYLRAQDDTGSRLGIGLELLGFALLAFFIARLYAALREAEGPGGWLARVALVGGVVTLAVKLGSAAPYLVGHATVETLSGEQARVLLDLGDAAFLVSAMTSGILVLGAALSALQSGLLPRWLAWVGVAAGALAVLGSLQPFSLDGGPGVLGWLLGLLWLAAVSVTLTARPEPVGRAAGREAALASA
jgi:hypothetical protein